MPIIMNCPFFKSEQKTKLNCEGATLKFPSITERWEYITEYCTSVSNWQNCPVARYMINFYDRKENGND